MHSLFHHSFDFSDHELCSLTNAEASQLNILNKLNKLSLSGFSGNQVKLENNSIRQLKNNFYINPSSMAKSPKPLLSCENPSL